jgi:hypothetical protein
MSNILTERYNNNNNNNITVIITSINYETYKIVKGKVVPLHAMVALGGEMRYSSYSYLTSALDGGEWSASRSGRALPPAPIG